jgi:hypothetical protein
VKKIINQANKELALAIFDLQNCLKIKPLSFSFNSAELSLKYYNEIVAPKIKGEKNVIYIIKSNEKYNLTKALKKFKSLNSTMKLPQINENNFDSKVLYVGSVQNNFKNRIKQHLGFGSNTTYSLKLGLWTVREKLNITIEYFVLENTNSDITLKLLETMLAYSLKPAFGKHDKIKMK